MISKRNTNKPFELLFSTRIPLLFLASTILLSVMGNMVGDLIKSYFGDQQTNLWSYIGICVIALILLLLAIYMAGFFGAKLTARREYRFLDKPNPASRKGLIAFVSLKQRAHLDRAISYHKKTLERVWLIATRESQTLAAQIVTEWDGSAVRFTIIPLQEEWDVFKTKETIDKVYAEQLDGLAEEEAIADFTGGTKPMTVGMIFACLTPTRALQYVPADYGKDGSIRPLDPIEYKFDTRMIGSLGGSTS
jgi:hypothetical protein